MAVRPSQRGRDVLEVLRERVPGEEFDYATLMDVLRGYARPRSKVTAMLKAGSVVRVKKGIYIFGPSARRRAFSREILANMIYGPSYVSLESALQRHGLIPEGVTLMTSVTPGRARRFSTPVGVFTYHRVPKAGFPLGMDRLEVDGEGRAALMATAEKALADRLFTARGLSIQSVKEMGAYLRDNLRIDADRLRELDPDKLKLYGARYRSRKILLASRCLRKGESTP